MTEPAGIEPAGIARNGAARRRRVLLLNPPGRDLYIRDYFCSKTTKSNYLFHPIDLVVLSGSFAAQHEVAVLDAIAERLSPADALERVRAFAPDAIVSLVGAVSWEEDREFLRAAKEATRAALYVIGDVIHDGGEPVLEDEPWIDGCFQSFANGDALALVEERDADLADACVRRGGRVERRRAAKARGTYRVPTPRHDLFPRRGYSFSFARRAPFATVLTDYGCPYPCTFCVIGTLGFAQRPVEDVLEELRFLRSLGVRELFVMDQTFGVVRARGLELCAAMERLKLDFTWTTYARPDLADAELLGAMKRAGCHTVMMGVETPDDAVLASYRKGYLSDEVRTGFARARAAGLRTVGTFIIGLPEETEESIQRTVDYAIELGMDFASFNVAVPRFGTPFRRDAIAQGVADPAARMMDQGGATASMPTLTLSRERMEALKRRAIRRFYLRPSYLLRRLASVRTAHELRSQVAEGIALLRRNV
ncbi:MAG TPA: B12-binding domain-containing radical SAM protein [Planctomycetota bacterium]|nr:B12-binding domain-containing radical SAM protein [Planctomycetota bacterium]